MTLCSPVGTEQTTTPGRTNSLSTATAWRPLGRGAEETNAPLTSSPHDSTLTCSSSTTCPFPAFGPTAPLTGLRIRKTNVRVTLGDWDYGQWRADLRRGTRSQYHLPGQHLARAGTVHTMEYDINTDWVNFARFRPVTPRGPAISLNATKPISTTESPKRYSAKRWKRDFITISARSSGG